jgi:hypothetical protein
MYQMSNGEVSGHYQLAILDLLSNAGQTTIGGEALVVKAH